MNKFHGQNAAHRRAHALKLKLSDGYRTRYLTATELADIAGYSKSHAYRLLKEPDRIQPGVLDLLKIRVLGTIPGFGPGWYFNDNGITGPNGESFTPVDLENFSLAMQSMRFYEQDTQKLRDQIEWLQKKLAAPEKLRKYSNPKVIQFEHAKQRVKEG